MHPIYLSINEIDVVLASEAQWRSDLLSKLGIVHRAVPHQYDEPKHRVGSLAGFAGQLAQEKARSLESQYPNSIIIASDQVVALDGQVLNKPGNKENALIQLTDLAGKWHELHCGLAVYYKKKIIVRVESSRLKMRDLKKEELDFYLEQDQPFGCCGSYKIESLGLSLFEEIETKDFNSIIGLSTIQLITILREWGISNLR